METKVTPSLAIWRATVALRKELIKWKDQDDTTGDVAAIREEIAALEQVRKDLETLQKIRAAFAALAE